MMRSKGFLSLSVIQNMKRLLAFIVVIILSINFYPAMAQEKNDLPSYFNWRDINGIDYTTPVKNQEPCPSCEAYALVACLETMVQYKVGYPFGCDLSEAHLFFCSGGTCRWGVNVTHAAQYLVEYGVPDEGCFPDPHRKTDSECNPLPGWENRTVKIRKWGWVNDDMESIKKAIIEHGPVVACIHVWKDFMVYHGGIYRHRWGKRVGGHLIVIVGYDDEQKCWICKNSWGKNWGEDGWFRVAYDKDIFIHHCYGGSGILYMDGVYGNLMPDVPKVYIKEPERWHIYIFGRELPTLFGRTVVQIGIPRIIGGMNVVVNATNTNRVEFYLDGELKDMDDSPPFEWHFNAKPGKHTIEVMGYNEGNASRAMVDVFVLA